MLTKVAAKHSQVRHDRYVGGKKRKRFLISKTKKLKTASHNKIRYKQCNDLD